MSEGADHEKSIAAPFFPPNQTASSFNSPFQNRQLSSLRRRVLIWFDRHRRELPWRLDRDPYRIWVSEVMLQQTTVATVLPRFERFMCAFPTLHTLAEADEQEVLRQWQGLGYYRRARDLHRASRLMVEQHGGRLPDDVEAWKQLPGVGRYIMGAVLSQAFDRRLPIVEVNSQRVLCRLYGQDQDPKSPAVREWLWRTATTVLPRKRAGDFNQAIMELGAMLCTPNRPRCKQCPLASICVARKMGTQETIPMRPAAVPRVSVKEVAIVVRKGSNVLLARRPESGRWGNMWEFPHVSLEAKESHDDAAKRLLEDVLGIRAKLGRELITIRHAVTRFRIAMVCLEAFHRSGTFRSSYYKEARWLAPKEISAYPISTPQRELAEQVAKSDRQRLLF